ncbi:MBL fold metallo-hydrolase [Kribbella solani]|uniref:MBL fold metallo-hydrolase n=1 Tax=Kribbella solani TaxID=236067 RepID=UPI0029BD185A|nr:MBL fold metallo-hydrolase [Kribbella solani]MDX3005060.1 MBL fold metallo-hydrolase [Kribbella solani]
MPGQHSQPATSLIVRTVETPSLGDRSYLVHDGEVAFVIDPQRDIDRMLELLRVEAVRLTHVFETHIHNDYVTGGLALAQATGATYLVNADGEVAFDRTPLRDGDVIQIGDRMQVRAIHTPGHTFTHLSYALTDNDQPIAVFTGGSLLYGATGRPDLLGPEHTDALVRHQHASAQELARTHRISRCPSAPTPPSSGAGSRPANGSSTYGPAPPLRPATHPAPSTSASTARSRRTLAGSSPGAPR